MKVRPSLDWLLALVPVAIGMRLFGAPEIAIFLTSAAAIVPLAGLIGRATELAAAQVLEERSQLVQHRVSVNA